jgi:permuted papain-like amidase YaeF/Yiix C92 family enzyme
LPLPPGAVIIVRMTRLGRLAIAALPLAGACSAAVHPAWEAREGDVVFQSLPRCDLVDAIEGATRSPYSHCGIVVRAADAFAVLEAFGDVHETPLDEWIARGRNRAFAAYRLRDEWSARASAFVAEARREVGKPYDVHYAAGDDAIYCSELIQLAFQRAAGVPLGRTQKLSELDWAPFESVIREVEGGAVPLDREMITPRAIAEAAPLVCVREFGP